MTTMCECLRLSHVNIWMTDEKKMTDADRFRYLLKRLDLTQTPAAWNDDPYSSASMLLDVDERLVRRWADGSKDIPRSVMLVLEIMVAWNIKPIDLKILKQTKT